MIKLRSKPGIKLLVLTALLLSSLGILEGQTATAPAIGVGSVNNPYQIATLENLYWIAASNNVVPEPSIGVRWRSHYVQTADIDASETREWFGGAGWLPIAASEDSGFRDASYNGQDHTIDGLFISRGSAGGLFATTRGSRIENLGLTNVDIRGIRNIGALVGWAQSTLITNCYTTGNVRGNIDVGGLVGRFCSGNIINNSYSEANVTGTSGVGGLVGFSCCNSLLNNCYSTGNITGDHSAGGLVGMVRRVRLHNSYYNYEQVLINRRNLITIGAVNDEMFNIWLENDLSLDIDDYLVLDEDKYLISSVNDFKNLLAFGQYEDHSFKLTTNLNLEEHRDFYIPYFSGSFDGNGFVIDNLRISYNALSYLGLFGYTGSGSTVENLGVTNVDVSGHEDTGGLVGINCGTISNCYTTGRVTGSGAYVGGLVGTSQFLIRNSYSTASSTARWYAGGLLGWSYRSTVRNSYSTGSVTGENSPGGLIGYIESNPTTVNSYWNRETSGQNTSDGGEGRTTDQMSYPYAENTYVDWDFHQIWAEDTNRIHHGYPYLQWQYRFEPDIASNPAPENSADHVFLDLEHLSWNYQDDPFRSTPAGFRVYFNDTGEFGEDDEFVWVPYLEEQEGYAAGEILPERLEYGIRYYWKVVPTTREEGVGGGYDALNCPVWSFTTELNPAPSAALIPYPSDDSTGVYVNLEELKWDYIVDTTHVNPAGFRVYFNDTGEFGEDDEFAWVLYEEERVTFSSSDILPEAGLDYNTAYYWKVVPTTREEGVGEGYDALNVPVWSFTTEPEPTSVEVFDPQLITSLHGNYPNPFNPETMIEFSIKEDTEAILHIYNLKGQLVKSLWDGVIRTGNHSLIWNGRDESGNEVGSGVYFYRLKTAHYDQVNKMLLVK